ncbi:hypothetical protein BKP45_10645 [Anaerobacillus alkalidiazotrophicus]|uniref:Uncharacterized protein n=1 Tax=Anaerobacillus alkalidiazotrophicus TaxID=472963 RepID=A0A1S2M029_9BACI|nr:hypothetical protein [Anaerobacillus alkalidiazotrophicus]OIJ18052.1 hypothetical protein BKP45_16360 [Anaerobacillus alkalidiazotrophicus]OIJ19531.1 hypothetical protein BKP45_10645 [Anaerobacillus alkalidiazotrophicus]
MVELTMQEMKGTHKDHFLEFLNNYNGLTYFDNLLYSANQYLMLLFVLLIGFGMHLVGNTVTFQQRDFHKGLVENIVSKTHIKNVIVAQALYIMTFVASILLIAIGAAMLLWGGNIFQPFINSFVGEFYGWSYILVMIGHVLLLITFLVLVITISSLIVPNVKNKFVVKMVPFILCLLTFLVVLTIGNLHWILDKITYYLRVDTYLFSLYNFISQESWSTKHLVLEMLTLFISLLVLTLYLIRVNKRKFETIA